MKVRPRGAAAAALALAAAVGPLAAAPPDAKLREEIKASIDLGVNWLRWQIDGEGTWRGDAYTTARGVRVFAESHRKYVEEDGPFMRRPVGFLRQALASEPSPVVSAAAVLALAPLNAASDAALIRLHGDAARAWLAANASAARPTDLDQVALAVAAVRAAGLPAGPDLLRDADVLLTHGSTNGPIPGFADALRVETLIRAGAPRDDERVRQGLQAIAKRWGWWNDPARAKAHGYAVVPPRYWHALARALDAAGMPEIRDAAGTPHDWKVELARAIIPAQQFDGYWVEMNDRIGDTITAVAALELIYRQ